MAKAIKFNDNVYLRTDSIVHGRQLLSDIIYPVGSIYITINNVNPNTLFGGTWELLSGGYLYAAQSTISKTSYTGWGTQSGGASTTGSTKLTAAQSGVGSHTHRIGFKTSWDSTVWDKATQDGYVGPRTSGSNLNYGSGPAGPFVEPKYGTLFNETVSQDASSGHTHSTPNHTHNLATVDVFLWKRTA